METGSTNIGDVGLAGLWFQKKQGAEEVEVGEDPQIGFTEMDEDRKVKDGVRIKMVDLNPIELEQSKR